MGIFTVRIRDGLEHYRASFTGLLLRVSQRCPALPLMITDNGAAFEDEVSADGRVHDANRVDYLYRHRDAAGAAIDAGADVRGYFVWSLLGNFEWSFGYDRRFGIFRVDFDTLERTQCALVWEVGADQHPAGPGGLTAPPGPSGLSKSEIVAGHQQPVRRRTRG